MTAPPEPTPCLAGLLPLPARERFPPPTIGNCSSYFQYRANKAGCFQTRSHSGACRWAALRLPPGCSLLLNIYSAGGAGGCCAGTGLQRARLCRRVLEAFRTDPNAANQNSFSTVIPALSPLFLPRSPLLSLLLQPGSLEQQRGKRLDGKSFPSKEDGIVTYLFYFLLI